jgi:hypothetical protein
MGGEVGAQQSGNRVGSPEGLETAEAEASAFVLDSHARDVGRLGRPRQIQ